MAQVFATTPQKIYNVLANDTTFSSYLGTTTFTNGATADSVFILTPGEKLPQVKSQVGLECIIHDSGDVTRKDYVNDGSDFLTTWKVFLIVWDEATASTPSAFDVTVTGAVSPDYYIITAVDRKGNVSGNNPALTYNVGDTITFDLSALGGAHPLYIRTALGGVSAGGVSGEGTDTVTWNTTGLAAGTYYYQCGIHPNMYGAVTLREPGRTLDAAVKRLMYLFYGSTSIETVSVSEGLGARVQTMAMIPEDGGLHQDAVDILNSLP